MIDNKRAMIVWDAESGEMLEQREAPGGPGFVCPDYRTVAFSVGPKALHFWDSESDREQGALLALRNEQSAIISPDGHWCGTARVARDLVYVVKTAKGQRTMTPEKFATEYGWTNDPEKVRLVDVRGGN